MQIEPAWNGEKCIFPGTFTPNLIYENRVINRIDAAHFFLSYRNLYSRPDELIVDRLE